jgi:UDP-2,3-diacylglucosamine pyrophosphatase LpxH
MMLAEKRLTQAYQNARVLEFDDTSRLIFFSDSHRGDNSLSDEFARNQHIFQYALAYYFYNGYTYIEAGDGDELWEYKQFKHIRIAHSDIFHLLQLFHEEERLIMLYGNHNMALRNPEYVRRNLHSYYDE